MIFRFPASTDMLIRMNHGIYPDAMREMLSFYSLTGKIRQIAGKWHLIPRGEEIEKPLQLRPRKTFANCAVCGKEVRSRGRGCRCCSVECKNAYMTAPRPPCKHCGKPTKRKDRPFCSRECSQKYRPGQPRKVK
jgi:endogenous inhibitor of DNA gyrase (YacG/DUF329 family)